MFVRNANDPWVKAEVYPYIDKKEDAAWAERITVNNEGMIFWQNTQWTRKDFMRYIAMISAAMNEAFDIAESEVAAQKETA